MYNRLKLADSYISKIYFNWNLIIKIYILLFIYFLLLTNLEYLPLGEVQPRQSH